MIDSSPSRFYDASGDVPEALFFRQLQRVTARIHETDNVEQLMLDVSADICRLFNADRLTLYVVNDDHTAIVSKIKTGLSSSKDLKLPIGIQSIAGYVAQSHKLLNLPDVYDQAALHEIHPDLHFLKEVDKRSGYLTRQMLVAPVLEGVALYGVLQLINNKGHRSFNALEVDGLEQLCQTLATAIRQRLHKANEPPPVKRPNTMVWWAMAYSLKVS